jgi:tetratricopeptide (TPR) repeat protein
MNAGQSGSGVHALTIGALYTKALELLNANRLDEAQSVCDQIVAVRPKQADVYNIMGGIAYRKKDSAGAVKNFQKSLKLDPGNIGTHLNLARVYRDFAMWPEAARAFETLARKKTDDGQLLHDLAKSQAHAGKRGLSIENYRKALALQPASDLIEAELAEILFRENRFEEAEAHYNAILARDGKYVPALVNLAIMRDVQGRMDEAMTFLETAIALNPESVDAHFHHALALLARGRLAEGWAEYAWRYRRPAATTLHHRFRIPYWNGEPLQGRTLLVWSEQGLGDEILMGSMLPDVLAQGAKCILVCTHRLVPLFKRSFPGITVLERRDMKTDPSPGEVADFQASVSQLGLHLRASLPSFPPRNAYLKADPAVAASLREKYADGTSDRLVGIAWHSKHPQAGAEKSIALDAWAELVRTPGFRFVKLQYGRHPEAERALRKATGDRFIVDETVDPMKDMDAFTAQVAAMDLVISVSNTTVHVAGALGRPVWTLVPASIGRIWYWFLDRADSPWYPSMRLFRQPRGEAWTSTLAAATHDLSRLP